MHVDLPHQLLRLSAVLAARGKGHSSHYEDIARGLWTHPVPIGARSTGWPLREVNALIAARIAGKTDDEMRALVSTLEDERASALDEAMSAFPLHQAWVRGLAA